MLAALVVLVLSVAVQLARLTVLGMMRKGVAARLAAVGGAAVVSAVLVSTSFSWAPSAVSGTDRATVFEQCLSALMDRGDTLTFEELELSTTSCASTSLAGLSDVNQAQAVVREIFDRRDASPLLRERCHDAAHAFGVSFFSEWGAPALVPGLEECGFGFYHGLMMAVGASVDPKVATDHLMQFCSEYSSSRDDSSVANFDFCIHGIGHAFGARVSTAEAIELCSSGPLASIPSYFPDSHKYSWPVNCFTGALNEQLRYSYWAGTSPDSVADALEHCDGLKKGYALVCTSYSLHYSKVPLSEISELCPTLPAFEKLGCWWAVGFRGSVVMFDTRRDASAAALLRGVSAASIGSDPVAVARFVDRLCGEDSSNSCVERFTFETIQSSQNPEGMRIMCEELSNSGHSRECLKALDKVGGLQGT